MHELKPLYDRLIVQRLENVEEMSRGGIIKPAAHREKPQIGVVLEAGLGGRTDFGAVVPMQVKIGDYVAFGRHNGYELHVGDQTFTVLREDECFAVLRDVGDKVTDDGIFVDLSAQQPAPPQPELDEVDQALMRMTPEMREELRQRALEMARGDAAGDQPLPDETQEVPDGVKSQAAALMGDILGEAAVPELPAAVEDAAEEEYRHPDDGPTPK